MSPRVGVLVIVIVMRRIVTMIVVVVVNVVRRGPVDHGGSLVEGRALKTQGFEGSEPARRRMAMKGLVAPVRRHDGMRKETRAGTADHRYAAPMAELSAPLVWVDLEMTGLDPATCTIVEVATIVTDGNLNLIAEGPSLVVHQPEEVLATMNSFVHDLHVRSGLLDRIRSSTVSLEQAETETLAFLEHHAARGASPLCGNSVWKDRAFLEKYMPRVVNFLHYRMVDVSTIKELVRRWYPPAYHAPKKKEIHRALDDIRESIEELRWYRSKVLVTL